MATAKQLDANRRNAQKSTGPRTDLGKETSSRNALTHGLTAVHPFFEGEDPAQFDELRSSLEDQVQPVTALERLLVNRMAATAWRLGRVPLIEATVFEASAHPRDISAAPSRADLRPRKKRGRPPLSTSPVPAAPAHLTMGEALQQALSNNFLDKISRYDAALMNQLIRTEEQLHRLIHQRHQQTIAEATIKKSPDPPLTAEEGLKRIKWG